jgi:UDP-glucose 4-epimerase
MRQILADSRCTFLRGDLLKLDDLIEPLRNADGVFAVAGIMASTIRENPSLGLDVNIRGMQNALDACRTQGVRKVVFSSSVGVYGVTEDDPTDENSPLRWQETPPALTLYGASKIIGEGLARLYHELYGIDFIALRYSAVYGERQHRRALRGGYIAETCARVRHGDVPIIDDDGSQVQDYVYAGDVARANLLAMESKVTCESINICSGVDTSQKRVVEIILEACESSLKPEYRPVTVTRLPPAARQAYSRAKAARLLNWEPQVSIEKGIGNVLRWIDETGVSAA